KGGPLPQDRFRPTTGARRSAATGRAAAREPRAATPPRCREAISTRAASFDHLVGTGEHGRRHVKAERPRGFQVDHQLELDWSLNGKLARPGAMQDTVDISR